MAAYSLAASVTEAPFEQVLAALLVGVVFAIARWAGLGAPELGLARRHLGAGFRWGLGAAAVVVCGVAFVALLPVSQGFFEDDRFSDATAAEVAFDALVRIPIGTALFEELVFRSVLLALLLRRLRPDIAVGASALMFGLWHVLPALGFADSNAGVADGASLAVVPVTVAVTALAGGTLAWLRIRSGSVVAPIVVHAALNTSAVVAAWLVA